MARYNPKLDLVFKKLFGSEENKDLLLSLVNSVLPDDQQVVQLQLKNPYNVADYVKGKLSILDIKAEDEKGRLYDIEMQIKGSDFYGKRTLYYWAKMFGSQLDTVGQELELERKARIRREQDYDSLKKSIVISLMDFSFFDDERYHRCFTLRDRETCQSHPDLDYLDLYFVEMDKFEDRYPIVRTTLDRWVRFLNNAQFYRPDGLPDDLAQEEPIRKAIQRLEVMYFDRDERDIHEGQQKRYRDELSWMRSVLDKAAEGAVGKAVEEAVGKAVEEAVEKAVEKTAEETAAAKQEEIALNMIRLGIDLATIARATGLSVERLEAMRAQMG